MPRMWRRTNTGGTFLPPEIRVPRNNMFVCSRAMPALEVDAFTEEVCHAGNKQPFSIISPIGRPQDRRAFPLGSSFDYLWGELMGTRARHLGAASAVVNGYNCDLRPPEAQLLYLSAPSCRPRSKKFLEKTKSPPPSTPACPRKKRGTYWASCRRTRPAAPCRLRPRAPPFRIRGGLLRGRSSGAGSPRRVFRRG